MHDPLSERYQIGAAELARLGETVRQLLAGYPDVVAAYLYGSAARGEPARDVDIGVVFRRGSRDFLLCREIASRLAPFAPHRTEIDVRPLVGATPRFRIQVLRDGRLLYEANPGARIEFETQAMSEWLDFRPVWERLRANAFEKWRHG